MTFENTWKKHDESEVCPVNPDDVVTVETWSPVRATKPASDINWKYVKFYRVVERNA